LWNRLKLDGTIHGYAVLHQSLRRTIFQLQQEKYSETRSDFDLLLRKRNDIFIFDLNNPSCTILCNHGLIRPLDLVEQKFSFGSPLIVQCIGYLIFKKIERVPKCVVPFNDQSIDVVEMMKLVLPCFDKLKMEKALVNAFKTNEVKTFRPSESGTKVPAESNYLIELMSIFRSWFPPEMYTVASEVNVNKKFADIHIKYVERILYNENLKFRGTVLELVSNERYSHQTKGFESEKSILGHIKRAKYYGEILESDAWVIHFVTVTNFPKDETVKIQWGSSEYFFLINCRTVNSMYIYHDDKFQKFKMFVNYAGKTLKPFEVNLELIQ
jgi:hypothetical protein